MADKKIPFALSAPDKTVSMLLNEAVSQSLSRIAVDKDMMATATRFLLELTGQTMLHSFLTVDGIATYHKEVFTDAVKRDLVFAIYSSFVARYSADEEEMDELHKLIARSATVYVPSGEASVIPEELAGNMSDYATILTYLEGNPWVVCISLILMYWNHGMLMAHAKA